MFGTVYVYALQNQCSRRLLHIVVHITVTSLLDHGHATDSPSIAIQITVLRISHAAPT